MSRSPLQPEGSKTYADAWRAINILIRSDGSWSGRERNLCYRNRGDGTFEDVSFVSGLDLAADGRAFVPLDFDSDGDLDLIVKNRNGRQVRALRNDFSALAGRRLAIRLSGRESNRDGVGGRIWVETDRRTLMREIVSGSGYLSQRSRQAWFGLTAGERVRSVKVRWPLGAVQEVADPPQAGELTLIEGEIALRPSPRPAAPSLPSEPAGILTQGVVGTPLARPVPAPDFVLPLVDGQGQALRLSSLRGRSVLLNFWATWCPPCRRELAEFQQGLAALGRRGVDLVAVSVDEPSQLARVRSMTEELGLEFPVVLADMATAEAYSILNERLFDRRRALAIPTSLLLDGQGRIVRVFRGEVSSSEVLRAAGSGPVSPLPFAGQWIQSAPRRDFEELGSALAERGLSSAALTMFGEALAAGGRSARLLNNMAGVLVTSDEPDRAEGLLREALALEPAMADAKVNLASLLAGRGERAEAEQLLEQALASRPRDAQALSVLGTLHFSAGRLEVAEGLFRRAVEAQPDDSRLRENLGAALASMGVYAEAAAHYERARDLGAEGAALHTNLGVLYMQTGRIDEALPAFLQAAADAPGQAGPQLNLARFHMQAGDLERAALAVRRAKSLEPEDLAVLMAEAQVLVLQGADTAARQALSRILRQHPDLVQARTLLESLD